MSGVRRNIRGRGRESRVAGTQPKFRERAGLLADSHAACWSLYANRALPLARVVGSAFPVLPGPPETPEELKGPGHRLRQSTNH